MKKLIAFTLIAFMGVQAFAQSTSLPTTNVKDLKGASVPFNETITPGKVTMISFWATWCVPCKKEIKAIREHLSDWHNAADFNYMTVSVDDSRATAMVRSYARSQGWDFPAYQDPNSDLKRALNFQNVPFTVIVGKDGKIAYMHSGFAEGGEAELFEKIKELAEQK
ncbi:MAG TPA: TlpA disulfide reductase family protein [Edaphocola sp.]|nr:TlpA disulfide reductase family protein [Edaphocola sp.]